MKNIMIMILLTLASMVTAAGRVTNQVDSIVVLYSNWDLLTDIPISGPNFKYLQHLRYTVNDTVTIRKFQEEIESLTPTKNYTPNVRCKLHFFSCGRIVSTVCLNRWKVLYVGRTFSTSDILFKMINDVVDSQQKVDSVKDEFPYYTDSPITDKDLITNLITPYFYDNAGDEMQDYNLFVICSVDIYGNIVDLRFHRLPDYIAKNVEEDMKNVIMDNYKWNENPERSLADELLLYIKISKQ